MSTSVNYIPNGDSEKVTWLDNFDTKLINYSAVLNISPAELQGVSDDRAAFGYSISIVNMSKQTTQNMVAYKDQLKHVQKNTGPLSAAPGFPTAPVPPTAVESGVFDRMSKLVGRIKKSDNYTQSIGQDLDIVAPIATMDKSVMQPVLKVKLDAGKPRIKWHKDHSDAMELSVDRGDGAGFVIMGRFITPDYIDPYTLQGTATLAEWHYRAIYVIGNNVVGLMSQVSSIVVKKV